MVFLEAYAIEKDILPTDRYIIIHDYFTFSTFTRLFSYVVVDTLHTFTTSYIQYNNYHEGRPAILDKAIW
jgi:hypothetical protein